VRPDLDIGSNKLRGYDWFKNFTTFRNKARGHDAAPAELLERVCPDLEESLNILVENYSLFKRPWAHLSKQLAGSYKVVELSNGKHSFAPLSSRVRRPRIELSDGVYIHFDETQAFDQVGKVDMLYVNEDVKDFYFPNGAFTEKRFELLSYVTGATLFGESLPYLQPTESLPSSETQGIEVLDLQGNTFGNLPPTSTDYIHRPILESELAEVIQDDRYPIITLHGRGGIGKTSLALSSIRQVMEAERYGAVFWFSARDVDLFPEGPKPVKQQIRTVRDIADEFVRLMKPKEAEKSSFKSNEYLGDCLKKSPIEQPLLFIFDNFETIQNPVELYKWISSYVRIPNKVLITTRLRDFKGDYPIEVGGMTEEESETLIDLTTDKLRIKHLVNSKLKQDVCRESEGHPYVIKILLGEIAKLPQKPKIDRIIASKDAILDALFERIYQSLSLSAKQVFLTLCNSHQIVPRIALEAVLLRPDNERIDVDEAINEISQMSLIQITSSREEHDIGLTHCNRIPDRNGPDAR
jgi:hypothetical protein